MLFDVLSVCTCTETCCRGHYYPKNIAGDDFKDLMAGFDAEHVDDSD